MDETEQQPAAAAPESKLLEFYGYACPHCKKMEPLVAELEKELGVAVQKYEVWKDEQNARLMETYDAGLCMGVPFFYNTANKKFICGEADYGALKSWAQD